MWGRHEAAGGGRRWPMTLGLHPPARRDMSAILQASSRLMLLAPTSRRHQGELGMGGNGDWGTC